MTGWKMLRRREREMESDGGGGREGRRESQHGLVQAPSQHAAILHTRPPSTCPSFHPPSTLHPPSGVDRKLLSLSRRCGPPNVCSGNSGTSIYASLFQNRQNYKKIPKIQQKNTTGFTITHQSYRAIKRDCR